MTKYSCRITDTPKANHRPYFPSNRTVSRIAFSRPRTSSNCACVISRTPDTCPPQKFVLAAKPERVQVAGIAFMRGRDEQREVCITQHDDVYTTERKGACVRFDLAINTAARRSASAFVIVGGIASRAHAAAEICGVTEKYTYAPENVDAGNGFSGIATTALICAFRGDAS